MNADKNGQIGRLSADSMPAYNKWMKSRNLQKVRVNSLCVALFLSIQLFNYFLNISTLLSCGIVLVISIFNNKKIYINKKGLVFFLFILLWFGITKTFFVFGEETFVYLVFFLAYGGTALYLCDKEYIVKKTLYYLCIIHVLVSPIVLVSAITEGATMGQTYSLIGGVFALVLCVFSSRFRVNSLYKIVFSITLIIYIYKISLVSTRGAYLSVTIFFILYYIVAKINVSWKTIIILGLIFVATYVFYMYLYEIMLIIENTLSKIDLSINVVSKSVRLLETDRFDHNRNWFYNYAIEGIKKYWFIGQGIGAFEIQTGRVYIHNVILQLLFEGGIIYFLPFALILSKIPKWLFPAKNMQKDEQIFIILLISSSLVKLMFSETYLKEQKFFLLLMTLLIRRKE